MTEHADLEALSAYVDGEAPEWAAHVTGCPSCRATVDDLRAVAAAVGVPVEAPDPAVRETAVSAALGDLDRGHVAERFRPRRYERQLTVAAVAAVLVVLVGFSGIVYMNRTTSDDTTVAGPALQTDAGRESLSDTSAAAALPPTDLGDVADAATLLARARPALPASSAGAATSSANSGGGAAGGAANATSPPTPAGGQRALTPSAVGTRPCEEQARAREPSLREVVYFATARRGQVPAVVLGFSTGPSPAPITLLMLAQDGCAELLRAAGP